MTWHALRRIERDLADSDPRLNGIFLDFARQAGHGTMPRAEEIRTWPRHWPNRLGEILHCAVALMALACVMCLDGFRPGRSWIVPMLRVAPRRTY
jgi:hypothetical protein